MWKPFLADGLYKNVQWARFGPQVIVCFSLILVSPWKNFGFCSNIMESHWQVLSKQFLEVNYIFKRPFWLLCWELMMEQERPVRSSNLDERGEGFSGGDMKWLALEVEPKDLPVKMWRMRKRNQGWRLGHCLEQLWFTWQRLGEEQIGIGESPHQEFSVTFYPGSQLAGNPMPHLWVKSHSLLAMTSTFLSDELLDSPGRRNGALWAACPHPSLLNCFGFSPLSLLPHPPVLGNSTGASAVPTPLLLGLSFLVWERQTLWNLGSLRDELHCGEMTYPRLQKEREWDCDPWLSNLPSGALYIIRCTGMFLSCNSH